MLVSKSNLGIKISNTMSKSTSLPMYLINSNEINNNYLKIIHAIRTNILLLELKIKVIFDFII